jgi:hypothetical protein
VSTSRHYASLVSFSDVCVDDLCGRGWWLPHCAACRDKANRDPACGAVAASRRADQST